MNLSAVDNRICFCGNVWNDQGRAIAAGPIEKAKGGAASNGATQLKVRFEDLLQQQLNAAAVQLVSPIMPSASYGSLYSQIASRLFNGNPFSGYDSWGNGLSALYPLGGSIYPQSYIRSWGRSGA